MPWRLIGFILLLGIFLVFIVFNLDNACPVSFGFRVIPQVPVYLTALFSFVLGLLWTVPSLVSLHFKKAKNRKTGLEGHPPAPKKWGKKRDETPSIEDPATKNDEPYRKDGPYGID